MWKSEQKNKNGEGGRGVGRFMLRKEEGCVWLGEIRMVYDNL